MAPEVHRARRGDARAGPRRLAAESAPAADSYPRPGASSAPVGGCGCRGWHANIRSADMRDLGAGGFLRRWAAALAVSLGVLATASSAQALVVRHGYLALPDHTLLSYTLTLPAANGRYPVLLEYDPYAAGVTSDTSWAPDGYAMLGVNFRGTGCSQGTFQPLRGDIWGRDGANVVAWAGRQPWSDARVGMIGYSFTGVSQLATAEYAGPALKAITPENVFPDLYRDIVYPGGIYNSWISAWVAGRNFVLGEPVLAQSATDPMCDSGQVSQLGGDEAQTA